MSAPISKQPTLNSILGISIIGLPTAILNKLEYDLASNTFIWVATSGGEANTSSNSGAGAGLALPKVGVDLPFKSIIGELNRVTITVNADNLTFTIGTDVVVLTGVQTLEDKTLLLPVIASFINATHTHLDAAGGGLITSASLSDFAAAVAANAAVVLNTAKITNANHTGDVTGATVTTIGAKKVTIAMLADGVDGELITWDAAGVAAVVAVGISGEVLTSRGVGLPPTFQAGGGEGGSLDALGSELSSTPVVDTSETAANLQMFGQAITLPATHPFYVITAIEWKNGTVVDGNIIPAAYQIDTDPPANIEKLSLAEFAKTAQSGTSAVQKINALSSKIVAAGTVILIGVIADSGTGRLRFKGAEPNENSDFLLDNSIKAPVFNSAVWISTTNRMYVKLYFKEAGVA